jgi:hypothetical protein
MSLTVDFNSEPIECAICFDEIGPSNNCVTPCGHKFCFKCIVKSTKQNNSCPCCRGPLCEPSTMEEEEEEEDEYSDEEEYDEGEDEHNHTLAFGRVMNDAYHSPVVINSIEDLATILEEQGINSEQTETWIRVMIGMFMKKDEDEFKEADDTENISENYEEYVTNLRFIELVIEKEFKTFQKSIFLKKHFQRMVNQKKLLGLVVPQQQQGKYNT